MRNYAVCCVAFIAACVVHSQEVVLRAPGVSAATIQPWPTPSAATVDRLVAEIKEELPDYSIHKIGPWIVATNLSDSKVERYLEGTIGAYAAQIQRQLFRKNPRSAPVKVLLFKDRSSYDSGCKKFFATIPDTPYGFYSRANNAMAMNISTGGGTLLHEMVHAMAEADFPNIPAWLNEGLGSLYEASDMRDDGSVIGIKNWRLNELLPAINSRSATPLRDLFALSDDAFYGDRSSAYYAVSRYLMQYLQDQGKLEAFYARIRDHSDADACATLRAVFGNTKSVEEIQADYHDWVRKLGK